MKRTLTLFSMTLLTAGIVVGCSSGSQGETVTLVDKESNGYTLFQQSCAGCHGAELQGRAGPNLQHVGSKLAVDKIESRIKTGGAGMPAFGKQLEESQIAEIATWLSKQQ